MTSSSSSAARMAGSLPLTVSLSKFDGDASGAIRLRPPVGTTRRLSQRISEGDGIAIIVRVNDVDSARAAQEQGAKALAVDRAIEGLRESSSLPVLWLAGGGAVDADAVAIRPSGVDADG